MPPSEEAEVLLQCLGQNKYPPLFLKFAIIPLPKARVNNDNVHQVVYELCH